MQDNLVKELTEIGLTEKEARVYLAALDLGSATAQQIATKATVERPSTYLAIESLKKKGLMSEYKEGKRKRIRAATPNQLNYIITHQKRALEKKEASLKNLISELNREKQNDEIEVQVFEGVNGFEACQNIVAEESKGEVMEFTSCGLTKNHLPSEPFIEDIRFQICEKHDVKTYLVCDDDKHKRSGKEAAYIKLNPNDYPIGAEVSVINSKVFFTVYNEDIQTVLVDNEEIAKSIRSLLSAAK